MEQQPTLDAVCACIRAESKLGRLCPLSALPELVSAIPASATAASEGETALVAPSELEALLAQNAPEDVKLMRGAADSYYFSELSMTAAYAKHLFRVAEKDPLRLIAETAREESSAYPRPTPLIAFQSPPFALSAAEVEAAIASMAGRPEYADIARCAASNGDAYVYSTSSLTPAYAESLAEWASVGLKENP